MKKKKKYFPSLTRIFVIVNIVALSWFHRDIILLISLTPTPVYIIWAKKPKKKIQKLKEKKFKMPSDTSHNHGNSLFFVIFQEKKVFVKCQISFCYPASYDAQIRGHLKNEQTNTWPYYHLKRPGNSWPPPPLSCCTTTSYCWSSRRVGLLFCNESFLSRTADQQHNHPLLLRFHLLSCFSMSLLLLHINSRACRRQQKTRM